MDRLKGKIAIVTGAALGIGRATSQLLLKEGARVALTDVLDYEGKQLLQEMSECSGPLPNYWHLDTSKEREVVEVFADIRKRFGRIDILVNNAGIAGVNRPTDEVTEEDWDRLFAINVKGVFFCTKHVIPYMRQAQGGSIINLSSIYGLISAPDLPPYHASKGAVRLMTKTDALLFAKDNIRVNSVHPGFIWTPLVEKLAKESPEGIEGFRKHLNGLHPLGHVGEPDDIAHGIVYLASDEAKFVTGTELVIDGGYTAQ